MRTELSRWVACGVVAPLAMAWTVVVAPAVHAVGVPTEGDGGPGAVRAVVDRIDPPLPGVRVEVEVGPFTLVSLRNDSATPVDVLDPDGLPFLRIGPQGVLANLRSPWWYVSNSPSGSADAPASADGRSPARWGRVSDRPRWGWFDPRVSGETGGHHGESEGEWTLPLQYGGRPAEVHGYRKAQRTPPILRPRLTSPVPIAQGITVAVLPGRVPALFLKNTGTGVVLVRDQQGGPFARIGPEGVHVNTRSPAWPRAVRLGGAPTWTRVSEAPAFTWPETRLAGPGRWRLPLELSGRRLQLTGVTTVPGSERPRSGRSHATVRPAAATPRENPSGSLPWALGGLALVSGAALVRRRVRRQRR